MTHVVLRLLLKYRKQLILLLMPLLLLPLPIIVTSDEALCGYAMILMAVYWCTEAMPIPVTACVPVFLFPMLGLLTTTRVVDNYMKNTTMMFLGGLVVAISVERTNLHKRIATKVLLVIGTQPRWLMLGFMLPTWFLSMWISNTATSAMMLPMVEAVLEQLDPKRTNKTEGQDTQTETSDAAVVPHEEGVIVLRRPAFVHSDSCVVIEEAVMAVPISESITTGDIDVKPADDYEHQNGNLPHNGDIPLPTLSGDTSHHPDASKHGSSFELSHDEHNEANEHSDTSREQSEYDRMAKGLTLCVAYSANIGGTATLTGTSPNLIMKGQADELWESRELPPPVDFPTWMIFGLPIAVLCLVILWIYMQFFFLGFRKTFTFCKRKMEKRDEAIRQLIQKEYDSLGPMRFAEVAVSLLFALLVMLWFFRDPEFLRGWARGFKDGYIGVAVPAWLIAISLFVIPSTFPTSLGKVDSEPPSTIMDWHTVQHKMPWGTLMLFGGGYALADASTESGLAPWIGDQLTVLNVLPDWVMVLLLSVIVTLLTEVTSNSATCTILMPIVASMAQSIGKNPLYLMFPVTISCSFAFMLPVATPPNSIAFSYGRLKVVDMVKAGVIFNFICVFIVTLATHTWGMAYFNLNDIPWAADATNTTATPMFN